VSARARVRVYACVCARRLGSDSSSDSDTECLRARSGALTRTALRTTDDWAIAKHAFFEMARGMRDEVTRRRCAAGCPAGTVPSSTWRCTGYRIRRVVRTAH
jgi:hypothetical protein